MARFLRVFSQASFILAALVATCGLIATFMGEVTQGLAAVGIAIGSVVPLGILWILTESAGLLTEIRDILNVWLIESQRELRAEVGGLANPAYKPMEMSLSLPPGARRSV